MPRAALLSLGTHAVIGLVLFGGFSLFPKRFPKPPDQSAEVEIVIGTNARVNGSASTPPPPADAAPKPATAAAPPDPEPDPTTTPARTVEQAPGPPSVPTEPDPAAAIPATTTTSQPRARGAAQPAAKPRPPAQAAQPAPAPRPAPPLEDIRIGDGIAATNAEIGRIGSIRPAVRDNGNRAPAYPPAAARRHEHGTVVLRIFINVDGAVSGVDVLHSSGSPTLDTAARDQILTWHFRPAVLNGTPVPDIEEQEISFVEE